MRQLNPLVPIELDQLIQRLVSLDERQRPTSALEVQQELLKIKQHAAEATTGLNPVLASAPTQYSSPAVPPATVRSTNPAPVSPPTVPVSASPAPSPAYGQIPSLAPTSQARGIPRFAAVWTTGFMILFGLMLALTIAGSAIAFNINQPYGSSNPAGLDHAVELGLSVILLAVALVATGFVRSGVARGILLLTALAALVSGCAFLLQTIKDVQRSSSYLVPVDQSPNLFLTIGLAAAAIISLLWLARPYLLLDRIVLLVMFGAAAVCALLQYSGMDADVSKHIFLLLALILLVQGVLLAAQTERVRTRGRN